MKANEFVKKFGWKEAKTVCNGIFSGAVCYKWVELNIDELKRLVDSHELVECYGGYDLAKNAMQITPLRKSSYDLIENLKQAIADVESCMKGVS